jgi:hypothetical protein
MGVINGYILPNILLIIIIIGNPYQPTTMEWPRVLNTAQLNLNPWRLNVPSCPFASLPVGKTGSRATKSRGTGQILSLQFHAARQFLVAETISVASIAEGMWCYSSSLLSGHSWVPWSSTACLWRIYSKMKGLCRYSIDVWLVPLLLVAIAPLTHFPKMVGGKHFVLGRKGGHSYVETCSCTEYIIVSAFPTAYCGRQTCRCFKVLVGCLIKSAGKTSRSQEKGWGRGLWNSIARCKSCHGSSADGHATCCCLTCVSHEKWQLWEPISLIPFFGCDCWNKLDTWMADVGRRIFVTKLLL